MPDLGQLLDSLVTDVSARTRAPGAPTAIKQARRRRAKVAVAAAGAVAFIAVGGGLAAGTFGGSDRVSPIGEPTTAPESPTVQESVEASPGSPGFFTQELGKTLTQVPDWAITDNDPASSSSPVGTDLFRVTDPGPCWQEWESSEGMSWTTGGPFSISTPGTNDEALVVIGGYTFRSAAEASDAVARHADWLASCTAAAWRTRPIAQTGAVLASSADRVVWMQRTGHHVMTLQVNTTDGPPPLGVQVEVADLMWEEIMVAHL